jgi:uncharacterized protein YebE (UPF0316 family)
MEALLAAFVIFLMRVTDQTLGTLRIIFLVRGRRGIAGALGFLESLVWVLAARQVLTDLDEPIKILGFAAGFGAGTMLGGTIERWMALGNRLVRIVAPVDSPHAIDELREAGYGVTVLNGEGYEGAVRVAFSVVPRRQADQVLEIIAEKNPEAFVTIEDATLPNIPVVKRAASVRK